LNVLSLFLGPQPQEPLEENENKINRKCRVPRKQGAHFLGAQAQIQDSWVLFIISMKFQIDRVPSCLIFGIWDFGRIRKYATCAAYHDNVALNFSRAKTFHTSPHLFFEAKEPKLYLKRHIFLGKGPIQGQIPGFHTIVLSLYSKFQPSRCRNGKKKFNRRTDGQTNDSTKSIFIKCALKSPVKRFSKHFIVDSLTV
jgi:hypothetical protein